MTHISYLNLAFHFNYIHKYLQLIKVDTVEKTRILWNEEDVYPSEPIFVPRPDAKVINLEKHL